MKSLIFCRNPVLSDKLVQIFSQLEPESVSTAEEFRYVFTKDKPELVILEPGDIYMSVKDIINGNRVLPEVWLLTDGGKTPKEKEYKICSRIFDKDDLFTVSLALKRKKVKAVTFGVFDIFSNGEPVRFRNKKSKELLALCIDRRGGELLMNDAIESLWPEKGLNERSKRLYRKAVSNLKETLRNNGIEEIFVSRRGSCYVRAKYMDCDYYRFLSDPRKYCIEFMGEYLLHYPWGERTLGLLVRLTQHLEGNF